jgi:hypothetical protein
MTQAVLLPLALVEAVVLPDGELLDGELAHADSRIAETPVIAAVAISEVRFTSRNSLLLH